MNYKYLTAFLVIGILIITSLTVENTHLSQEAASLRGSGSVPLGSNDAPKSCEICTITVDNKVLGGAHINGGACLLGYTCAPNGGVVKSPNGTTVVSETTPAGSPSIITHDLQKDGKDNTKEEVMALQSFLIAKGYLSAGDDTGKFGPATREAVIKFQDDNGLPSTGIVGEKTRALIQSQM